MHLDAPDCRGTLAGIKSSLQPAAQPILRFPTSRVLCREIKQAFATELASA